MLLLLLHMYEINVPISPSFLPIKEYKQHDSQKFNMFEHSHQRVRFYDKLGEQVDNL